MVNYTKSITSLYTLMHRTKALDARISFTAIFSIEWGFEG